MLGRKDELGIRSIGIWRWLWAFAFFILFASACKGGCLSQPSCPEFFAEYVDLDNYEETVPDEDWQELDLQPFGIPAQISVPADFEFELDEGILIASPRGSMGYTFFRFGETLRGEKWGEVDGAEWIERDGEVGGQDSAEICSYRPKRKSEVVSHPPESTSPRILRKHRLSVAGEEYTITYSVSTREAADWLPQMEGMMNSIKWTR